MMSLKSEPFPAQVLPQQLLRERDLPEEPGGKGGLEAALEHHSTAKGTAGWMLSLYDLVLHVLLLE